MKGYPLPHLFNSPITCWSILRKTVRVSGPLVILSRRWPEEQSPIPSFVLIYQAEGCEGLVDRPPEKPRSRRRVREIHLWTFRWGFDTENSMLEILVYSMKWAISRGMQQTFEVHKNTSTRLADRGKDVPTPCSCKTLHYTLHRPLCPWILGYSRNKISECAETRVSDLYI